VRFRAQTGAGIAFRADEGKGKGGGAGMARRIPLAQFLDVRA